MSDSLHMGHDFEIGGYKISGMVVMIVTGIIGMIVFYYFFMSGSSTSSSTSTGSGSNSYASELAAYEQYQASQAQTQDAQTATSDQYNLANAQLADQLAATQSTNNAATSQAAMSAGTSLGEAVAQLGSNNVQSELGAVQDIYAANYAAGTSIANTALNAAAQGEGIGLEAMTGMQASANSNLANIANSQNNSLSNLFSSIGGTTASVTASNAAWKPTQYKIGGGFGGAHGSVEV